MPHVTRRLPAQPHLDIPKRQARELLKGWRAGDPDALDRIRSRHPKYHAADRAMLAAAPARLSDAQWVIAREFNFASWAELKRRIEAQPQSHALEQAIRADERDTVVRILREHPHLIHLPVRSGNWGPPLSFAANLGRLEIIQAVADLGARDFQHAFDRALLQGRLACARWLHDHGARLAPGIVMGACETLNAAALRFLADLGAPFTDQHGNPHAPLAMVLETYSREPAGKHEALAILAAQGCHLPDTPLMAFHRGDVARLREYLAHDPALLERPFAYREIYPPELGCHDDGRSGLHGTPLDGATLLHLAIDFDEPEIFDLLLDSGAEVNAPAAVDSNGFGGHTPLFNAVVSCATMFGRQRDAAMARTLLERGAQRGARASLRKFLDWRETPGWHEAREITPVEWGRGFPEPAWVNREAVRLLERA